MGNSVENEPLRLNGTEERAWSTLGHGEGTGQVAGSTDQGTQ